MRPNDSRDTPVVRQEGDMTSCDSLQNFNHYHNMPQMRCQKCGTTDIKKVSQIYNEGTFIGETQNYGVLIDTSDVGVGVFGGPSNHQSLMAAQYAPPREPTSGIWVGFHVIVIFLLLMFLFGGCSNISDNFIAEGLFWFACFGAILLAWLFILSFTNKRLQKKQNEYLLKLARWHKVWACLRCGHVWLENNQ